MQPLIFDVSRLSTRVLNATPNGIDRIDMMLARHFLRRAQAQSLLFGFSGPRLFEREDLSDPTLPLDDAWGENESDAAVVASLSRVLDRKRVNRVDAARPRQDAILAPGARKALRVAAALARYGFRKGSPPGERAAPGALYVNCAHYPLERPAHVRWLAERRDIRPAFFIHDLLPVQRPEFFWNAEPERHGRRLRLLAERGAGAIVPSRHVAIELAALMGAMGRRDLPILAAHPPVSRTFREPGFDDARLRARDYFVMCGTIEPRKNHVLALAIWRNLIGRMARPPKLAIVGKRGWRCAEIVKAFDAPGLRDHVVEISGLSTPAYRALLRNARALLAPSTAEGFGLTLAEALTAGTPVIASDIAPHREQAQGAALLLAPGDAAGWTNAILDFSAPDSGRRAEWLQRAGAYVPVNPGAYFAEVDAFLESLPGLRQADPR